MTNLFGLDRFRFCQTNFKNNIIFLSFSLSLSSTHAQASKHSCNLAVAKSLWLDSLVCDYKAMGSSSGPANWEKKIPVYEKAAMKAVSN